MILEIFVLFFFFNLDGNGEFGLRVIYDILNLFFFKHGLSKISPLKLIFKASKFLFFFIIIIFGGHPEQEKERIKYNVYIRCTHQVL